MNGHDLDGVGRNGTDGFWTSPVEFPKGVHLSVNGGDIVTVFGTDFSDHGQPRLSELTLGVIGVGHQQVRMVQHIVKNLVHRTAIDQASKAFQEHTNTRIRGVGDQMRPGVFVGPHALQASRRSVFIHAHDG